MHQAAASSWRESTFIVVAFGHCVARAARYDRHRHACQVKQHSSDQQIEVAEVDVHLHPADIAQPQMSRARHSVGHSTVSCHLRAPDGSMSLQMPGYAALRCCLSCDEDSQSTGTKH